jgi:hypothetical protein
MRPFRYDNIKSHVNNQHPTKWAEYKRLDSIVEHQAFFDDVSVAFKNSIKAHFPSSFLGVERQIVFDIEKDIVDVIMRGMMFEPADIVDSDADSDVEENDPAFGNDVECDAVLRRCIQKAALAKERSLSLFQRVDQEEEEEGNASYFYSVTIPKSKTTVFQLSVRYVSCGASFRLASNILSCTYDVLHNPILRACSRHDVANYIKLCVLSTCNALLAICAVHGHFQLRWTLQLIKAPRISMCIFESSCQPSITLLTCMRLRFQCSIGTPARSCSRWLYISWTFFTLVGRFIYLVCLLMEPAT